jgi:hypothetical protein
MLIYLKIKYAVKVKAILYKGSVLYTQRKTGVRPEKYMQGIKVPVRRANEHAEAGFSNRHFSHAHYTLLLIEKPFSYGL